MMFSLKLKFQLVKKLDQHPTITPQYLVCLFKETSTQIKMNALMMEFKTAFNLLSMRSGQLLKQFFTL